MRLALSNDALKTISVPSVRLISHNLDATESSNSADSMTQGPAINIGVIIVDYYFNDLITRWLTSWMRLTSILTTLRS